jgi:hypothetical protein
MRNHIEDIRAQIQEDHPGWKVWYVVKALGGVIWSAKPEYETQPILHASSPEELVALIAEQPPA